MVRRLAVVAGLFLLGCGGSGDGGKSAPEKCDDLVQLVCVRAVACINDGTTQAECEASVRTGIACSGATGVSSTYESCMDDLADSPCSVLTANDTINLPASCNGAILFRQ